MKIVVTGAAGFIGASFIKAISQDCNQIFAWDSMTEYYSPKYKMARAGWADKFKHEHGRLIWCFADIAEDKDFIDSIKQHKPDVIIHLAAQAGVRCDDAFAFNHSNLTAFTHVLEAARENNTPFVYASSSSVYGGGSNLKETDHCDRHTSFYGATKRANELMAASYAEMYGVRSIGLRFFTVYGPWGRPDMSFFKFAKGVIEGSSVQIFGEGRHIRQFTHIDDAVSAIRCAINILINGTKISNHELFNVAGPTSITNGEAAHMIAVALCGSLRAQHMPIQRGDVWKCEGDTTKLRAHGWSPMTDLHEGIAEYIEWFGHAYRQKLFHECGLIN